MGTLEENLYSLGGANESKGAVIIKLNGRNSAASIKSNVSDAVAGLSSRLRVTSIDTSGLRSNKKDKEQRSATNNRKISRLLVKQANAEADEYQEILAKQSLGDDLSVGDSIQMGEHDLAGLTPIDL